MRNSKGFAMPSPHTFASYEGGTAFDVAATLGLRLVIGEADYLSWSKLPMVGA
jgi:hypothetical protein